MDKKEYMELYLGEKDIQLTDEDIREWFDKIVDLLKELKASAYDLRWGKAPVYKNRVGICDSRFEDIHVFDGLHKLAEVVGEKVQVKDRGDGIYPYEHYFYYKGLYIYMLSKTVEGDDE